ncbi:hypothetical protein FisN_10Hh278 [Fistulifera solaris]|uniref:Nitroreductase domain-containing protein n=1 Tax=Fistulifera solaris TaxID=1519565 RepID=A0A1Z5JWV3_FISSO|nr:hypothetical protein FisN_10Hh278 [Fistulifera solaris]|eukprot:GAX18523.1 hypothetical protein FisN_10Hh278 [Fistulifera solaris]
MSKAQVFRAIAHQRRTINRFQTGRCIPPETLQDILESTLRTPTSFNLQPTQVILVQNRGTLQELADHVMLGPRNQYRTQDCSAMAVFLADLQASQRISRILQLEQGHRHPAYLSMLPLYTSFLLGEGHLATALKQGVTKVLSSSTEQPQPQIEPIQTWSTKQTALMAQSLILAATSHDLGTCVMEGFDGNQMKEVLRIPDRYHVPLVVAMGYEYEESSIQYTPRLPLKEVVFADTFGEPYHAVRNDTEDDDDAVANA